MPNINNKTQKNKNKNKKNKNKNKHIKRNNTSRLRIRKPSNNENNLYVSPVSPGTNFYTVSPNVLNLDNTVTPKTKAMLNTLTNRQTMIQRSHSYEGQNNYTEEQLAKNLEKITEGLEKP